MYKFEKLVIWGESLSLIQNVYKLSNRLPYMERDNLIDQMKRAVTSVSLNIAEGSGAQNDKEYKRFLYIAKKSLFEVVAILKIIEFLYKIDTKNLEEESTILIKRISSLINKLSLTDG